MKLYRILFALAPGAVLGGCASVANDSTHPLKVEPRMETGELVSGARCSVSNDYGQTNFRSGDTIQVRRSSQDLDVGCTHPDGQQTARARAISRANAGMWGNIIIGGGIGAIIDHNKGTAYTYPTWIQPVFGRIMIFDRSAEKDGQPVPGTEPVGSPPLTVQPASPVATPASATASAKPAAPLGGEVLPPKVVPPPIGKDSYVAERLARELNCDAQKGASLVGKGPGYENFSLACPNGETLIIRCEMGNCRVLK